MTKKSGTKVKITFLTSTKIKDLLVQSGEREERDMSSQINFILKKYFGI